jgi:hypothetical protein
LIKVGVVSGLIKKIEGFSHDFGIFWDFSKLIFIGKVMDRVYGSWYHSWLSVHGGLTTMARGGRSGARELVVIAQREREKFIRVLINGVTWRWSCGDDHMTEHNRDDQWCFDGEMVPSTRRRD